MRLRRSIIEPTGLAVVGITLIAAMVGPVRSSGPVTRLFACRNVSVTHSADHSFAAQGTQVEYRVGGTTRTLVAGDRRLSDFETAGLIDQIRCNESFRVTVTARSFNAVQAGPRRLMSISEGTTPEQQNFMIGQSAEDLSVRIKFRRDKFEEYTVPGIFSNDLSNSNDVSHEIVVQYAEGHVQVFVDGERKTQPAPRRCHVVELGPVVPLEHRKRTDRRPTVRGRGRNATNRNLRDLTPDT